MMKMPSWCENGAKKCHTLAKSFSSYEFETRFFLLIVVGVKDNLENYTSRKLNPTNDSLFSSSMCQKGLNRNHESSALVLTHLYTIKPGQLRTLVKAKL